MSPKTLPSLFCTTALLLAAGIGGCNAEPDEDSDTDNDGITDGVEDMNQDGVNREPTDPTIRSVEGVDVQSVSGEDYMVET